LRRKLVRFLAAHPAAFDAMLTWFAG